MSDRVRISHPDYPGVVREISRGAYERRSQALGWQLTDQAVAAKPAEPSPAPEELNAVLDERARLRSELEALGVKFHHKSGVAKLQAQLDEAKAATEATE